MNFARTTGAALGLTVLVLACMLLQGAPAYAVTPEDTVTEEAVLPETSVVATPEAAAGVQERPVVRVVMETYEDVVPAREITICDPRRPVGEREVTRAAVDGKVRYVTRARYVDGVLQQREVVEIYMERLAVDGIVQVGTQVLPEWWPTGTLVQPVEGVVTSEYGARGSEHHTGIDIAAAEGTDVCAADGGEVVFAGWKGGYGWYVVIDHGDVETGYAHNRELYVEEGDCVAQGAVIAAMGSTGRSTGPHCHFEVRVDGEFREPREFVEIREAVRN